MIKMSLGGQPYRVNSSTPYLGCQEGLSSLTELELDSNAGERLLANERGAGFGSRTELGLLRVKRV
jgi:hypothetical protein